MIFAGFGVLWGLFWLFLLKRWSVHAVTFTGFGAIWALFWLLVGLAVLGGLAYVVYWIVAKLLDTFGERR